MPLAQILGGRNTSWTLGSLIPRRCQRKGAEPPSSGASIPRCGRTPLASSPPEGVAGGTGRFPMHRRARWMAALEGGRCGVPFVRPKTILGRTKTPQGRTKIIFGRPKRVFVRPKTIFDRPNAPFVRHVGVFCSPDKANPELFHWLWGSGR